MTEIEKIAYTKGFIEKLAEGINPMTGDPISEGELIRHARVSKCFSYLSDIQRQMIENGVIKGGEIPFVPGSLDKFEYSDTPILITELARRISTHKQKLNMGNLSNY